MVDQAEAHEHQGMLARHIDDMDWETIRWPGQLGKMMLHPSPPSLLPWTTQIRRVEH